MHWHALANMTMIPIWQNLLICATVLYGKNLSHFGQNVSKYKLKNTVTTSFNTSVKQMTEMFQ